MYRKAAALFIAASCLAVFSWAAVAGDAKDAIKKDRKALQGTWKTDKDNKAGITSIRFEGEKCTVTFKGDEFATGTYTIDPAQKIKTIDIKVTGGSEKVGQKYKGKTSLGVYELDGAKLKWHANQPGADERPKNLTEEEHVLIVFERAKK